MNRLYLFIELAYISMQAPGELTTFLGRLKESRRYVLTSLTLISLSLTVGRMIVSPGGPWSVMLAGGLLLHAALLYSFCVLFSLTLTFLAGRSGLDAARLDATVSAAIVSHMPLCFSAPAGILGHFLGLTWLFPVLTLLLFFWSLMNIVIFFQYQHEQRMRLVIRQSLLSLLIVMSFPFLVAFGFLLQILG